MIVIFDIQFVTSCNMVNDDTLKYEKHIYIYMYCEDLICNSIFRPTFEFRKISLPTTRLM